MCNARPSGRELGPLSPSSSQLGSWQPPRKATMTTPSPPTPPALPASTPRPFSMSSTLAPSSLSQPMMPWQSAMNTGQTPWRPRAPPATDDTASGSAPRQKKVTHSKSKKFANGAHLAASADACTGPRTKKVSMAPPAPGVEAAARRTAAALKRRRLPARDPAATHTQAVARRQDLELVPAGAALAPAGGAAPRSELAAADPPAPAALAALRPACGTAKLQPKQRARLPAVAPRPRPAAPRGSLLGPPLGGIVTMARRRARPCRCLGRGDAEP
mmetsp:Transcript_6675/g.18265  ORF Transcript_6675/g.18265 Transcript_6675/m.18265 type:complete len:273 (+) Transcript_6675:689-1507(+)